MRTHSESIWVDVGTPSKNVWGIPPLCPLPRFTPDVHGPYPHNEDDQCDLCVSSLPSSPVIVPRENRSLMQINVEAKTELHRVLNCIQCSNDFGIYVCEELRDPRRNYIDDYWREIADQALGVDDLHRVVGPVSNPLTDEARTRMHQFSRLLERLSKRIDRVVKA